MNLFEKIVYLIEIYLNNFFFTQLTLNYAAHNDRSSTQQTSQALIEDQKTFKLKIKII